MACKCSDNGQCDECAEREYHEQGEREYYEKLQQQEEFLMTSDAQKALKTFDKLAERFFIYYYESDWSDEVIEIRTALANAEKHDEAITCAKLWMTKHRELSEKVEGLVDALELISSHADLNEWTSEFELTDGARIARAALAAFREGEKG